MRTILLVSVLMCIFLFSCKKDSSLEFADKSSFIDSIAVNRYYSSEIQSLSEDGLYKTWKLVRVTGGIMGGEHPLSFDYLVMKPHGIYGVILNDTLKEYGKISVGEKGELGVFLSFQPDAASPSFVYDFEKYASMISKDTLLLIAPCCDRFSFEFVAEK